MTAAELFDFEPPIYLKTARGPKSLQKAPVTAEFWKAYRADTEGMRALLRSAGITLKKQADGSTEAQIWRDDLDARAREREAYDASFTEASTIEFPVPDKIVPYPYQLGGAEYLVNHAKALLGDDMGLGKTMQVILAANYLADKCRLIIVVCPPNLRINWTREIGKFSTTDPMIVPIEGTPKPRQAEGLMARIHHSSKQVYVVAGYSILKKWARLVHGMAWDIAVADEVHKIKNQNTIRSKMVAGEWDKDLKRRMGGIQAPYKFALTGTPIENRPAELITPLCWLDRIMEFGGPNAFRDRFCEPVVTDFGTQAKGFSNEQELNRRLRETCMIRRLKTSVLKQIPAKRHQVIPIIEDARLVAEESRAMSRTKTGKLFAGLQAMDESDDAEAYAEQVRKLEKAFKSDFAGMSRVRMELAVKKVRATLDHVLDCIEQTAEPIVLGCYHHECIRGFLEGFEKHGVKAVAYHGKMSQNDKQAAVDAFQDGDSEVQVFVGQLQAAGMGLTLTRSRHVIFHEFDWSPGVMDQFEDRCCRIGQDHSVLVQLMVIDGGFDSYMANMVLEKQIGIKAVLDVRVEQEPAAEEPTVEVVEPVTLASLARDGKLDDYGRYLASLPSLNEHQTKVAAAMVAQKTDENRRVDSPT